MLIRYGNEQQLSETTLLCNTGESGLFSNVSAIVAKKLPAIALHREAIICGGGPSLEDSLESIRKLKDEGGCIYALNNVAKWLVQHGIKPDYQVIVDPRPDNVDFLEAAWAEELLLCSQCHPDLVEQAEKVGYPIRVWHPSIPGIDKFISEKESVVTVSLTVGLSTICLAQSLGHVSFHLFGYDSSHKEGASHAYAQARNKDDEIVRCCVNGHIFHASMAMAGQANQFKEIYTMLVEKYGCQLEVHGEGLLPTLYRSWVAEKEARILTAVYDLGVSPPSYDFLSFLIEAERHRRANGYTAIDIVFQPGPMHGFRDDDLPPDVEARKGMLWRVCVGMARLLPSVRNIEVKGQRETMGGDVFPVGYKENQPLSHYATAYLKGGEPMLKASEAARRQVAKRFSKPYATISLRQAEYWPDRNSNVWEWVKVADWLKAQGIQPVIVPDTNGNGFAAFGQYTEFQAASFDIDLRAALYEGAVINLGVLNGPMSLLAYLDARYLIVKVNVETAVASTTEFLKAHGFESGDDFGGNGRFVWKPDTAENIIPELKEFEVQKDGVSQ